MKIKEAIEILENHNKWRCDNSVPSKYEATEPKKLTDAMNIAVSELKSDFLHPVVESYEEGDVVTHQIKRSVEIFHLNEAENTARVIYGSDIYEVGIEELKRD